MSTRDRPRSARSARRQPIPGEEWVRRRQGTPLWQIQFSIDGHRFRESSGTEDHVAACALAVRRWDEEWRRLKLGERPVVDLTIGEACVRYWQEVSQHTANGRNSQRYQLNILPLMLGADTHLRDITDNRVAQLAQDLRVRRIEPEDGGPAEERDRSPATINRYLMALHVVTRRAREVWGVEVGDWTVRRHLLAEPQGREVFLDMGQARALMDAIVPHARPIVLLALCTGLRRSNVVHMQWETVSLDMGRAVLVQKGNRRLTVELISEAIELLQHLQPDPGKRKGPVFWFGNPAVDCRCPHCVSDQYRGTPITTIKRSFATAVRAAGLRDMPAGTLRFHDLRHTFASWLLGQTGDLRMVQEALGHSQITTTARYAHLIPGRKRAGIQAAVSGLLDAPAADDEREAG